MSRPPGYGIRHVNLVTGISAIRHRRDWVPDGRPDAPEPARLWRDGFVVGLTNPKSTLFFLAVLPQFVTPERGHVWLQLLVLGLVFVVLAAINDGVYGVTAGSYAAWLERWPRRREVVGGTSGLLMIGLGVLVALTGLKH